MQRRMRGNREVDEPLRLRVGGVWGNGNPQAFGALSFWFESRHPSSSRQLVELTTWQDPTGPPG